ncbi:mitochondrial inner membrane protein OXA1L-like [Centruroides sculpturatus]|uniref:mitochondrial inner membrane protein OXA1L-like n=1 Tax=Centruroides sculpturatus TaxID=218467 RepID=UPI000C6ED2C7|nr:mitochondrial inner membrane protein OXA1L-like [Centruroides sculpturatus]
MYKSINSCLFRIGSRRLYLFPTRQYSWKIAARNVAYKNDKLNASIRFRNSQLSKHLGCQSCLFLTIPVRFQSDDTAYSEVINQASSVPASVTEQIIESSNTSTLLEAVEPSLISQGLGGWTPVGLLQHAFEYCHIDFDMPWWLTIVVSTVVIRTLMFPLVIKAQKNAIKMNNTLPQMQVLQMKMSNARRSGNALEATKYAHELAFFMKENGIDPLKGLIVPLVQVNCFLGGEGGQLPANMRLMKYVLRAMPIVIFPFIINFPSAILCYWATSNIYSLCQVAFLKIKPVRKFFNMPERKNLHTSELPMKSKGFVKDMKEAYTNAKVTRQLEERRYLDDVQFKKAGLGPIQKTYPYDPTKQSAASVQNKSKKL